jgi:hypothetical protein
VVRIGDELVVRPSTDRTAAGSGAYGPTRARATARDVLVRLGRADPASRLDVDRAYWAKYGRHGFGAAITATDAAGTTLRLELRATRSRHDH